jgi:hypothetical protein
MKTTSSERRSLIIFLVGVVLLAYLLARLGGWALPAVIAAVVLMVMGHEFGHFIVAKRSGMQVTDFFVGFGPVIWSTTRGETRYGVRALLLGGYVKVPGMSWDAKVEPALEKRTYRSATYPRQVLFASAGSLMHVVMALALAFASLTLVGLPSATHVDVSNDQGQRQSRSLRQDAKGFHWGRAVGGRGAFLVLGRGTGLLRQDRRDRLGRGARHDPRLLARRVLEPLPPGHFAGRRGESPFAVDPSGLDHRRGAPGGPRGPGRHR